jgi:hypothetical protein
MKAKLLIVISAVFIFCFGQIEVSACTCSPDVSVCGVVNELKNEKDEKAIFVGTVSSIEKVKIFDKEEKEFLHLKKVLFEVNESFSREINQKEFVYTFSDGASCGYLFEIGKKYLVYAGYAEELQILVTSLCWGNKEYESAISEIEVLRSIKQKKPVKPKIFGTVSLTGSKIGEKKLFKISARREENAVVIAKSVESGNSFEFSNLQFGKYWFMIFVDGVSFSISNPIDLNKNEVCREIEISVSENELKNLQRLR